MFEGALRRAGIHPSMVQEVFFGNVLTANLGQAPARQAALGAATMIAAQTIKFGVNDVVVAGGMESMSNAPKYIPTGRELCADQHNITREEQDSYAIKSFERGLAAESSGAFSWEIVPVEVSGGRGKPSAIVDKDEGLGKFDASKLRKLRPSFKEKGGSVTAGNASSIRNEHYLIKEFVFSAVMGLPLFLVSGAMAVKLGLKVIARIRGYADAAQAPELFTTAPAIAIPKAISNSGLKASNIDFYEINEAFSVVALANQKLLNIVPERLNAHGGAVSLGHPLGCSGARILVTLLGVLRQKNGKFGVAGVCNGGGGASAVVLELINDRLIVAWLLENFNAKGIVCDFSFPPFCIIFKSCSILRIYNYKPKVCEKHRKMFKGRQNVPASPRKLDIGEIDTRAPFQSVKAAVSLFGEAGSPKSSPVAKKTKAEERVLEKETQHHMLLRELDCYRDQLRSAETAKAQALRELQRANRTLQELTNKLEILGESKQASIKAAEAARIRTKNWKSCNPSELNRVTMRGKWTLKRKENVTRPVRQNSLPVKKSLQI
ncbi:UNVERIFIED_CONTAM: putative acetyl-CoA acetyltransferase, cytosolic 2 [Sesamum radiatum]|uniref:Acetyl-CoA acetyltransferase, cytosolic 2 n=1 Tax=Sesamum radiatum TaxID=300843 RepID=A0AAW2T2H8_SESRA